jgi:hypothetical protein
MRGPLQQLVGISREYSQTNVLLVSPKGDGRISKNCEEVERSGALNTDHAPNQNESEAFEMAEQNSTPDLDRETLEAADRFWSSLAKVDDTVIGRAIREKAEPEAWRAGRS